MSNGTSTISIKLPMEGERLSKVTQYGVEYPDGTVQWANAENLTADSEAVVLRPDWAGNANFYLAGTSSMHKDWGIAGLREAYRLHMIKQHAENWYLDIVKRTIVIAICAKELVNTA